jgi:hypothetical protein
MKSTGSKMNDEGVIRGLAESQGSYLSLDKDRLVLFAVGLLESRKVEPTFDKIVVAVFRLFPKKFSLIGFPEYPDGRTIYYCTYNHCTLDKKWLAGNVQSGFKITERGGYFLDETKKMLLGKIKVAKTHETIPRRKELTFVALLKKTDAYQKYLEGKKEEIAKSEIYEALKVPSNSEELIQTHLERYFEYSNRIGDSSVMEFLKFVKGKLRGDKDA